MRRRSRQHARWSQQQCLSREAERAAAIDRGRQTTLQCYSSQANVGHQSLFMESNEALCDSAIAQMIHGLDLPLSFASDPLFQDVFKTVRTVGFEYRPPARKVIGGTFLDTNYNTVQALNEKKLTENSDITGLQAMGDGATIRKMPLFNSWQRHMARLLCWERRNMDPGLNPSGRLAGPVIRTCTRHFWRSPREP